MNKQQVGIAMSGGVDSTACTLLLKDRYHVRGFFMNLGQPDFRLQKKRVAGIAHTIGIDLLILDLKKQFQELVLDYFSASYFAGKTPNPCMICNREIKFGLFMDAIIATGVEFVATGHYARIRKTAGETALLTGIDSKKDQSYFLSRLTRRQLSRVMFPLGSMVKNDTYQYVESHGFSDFRGKESQDICFLKNTDISTFLEQHLPRTIEEGPIITTDKKQIGLHKGLHRYTIGQRRGLGLPDSTPWYVCAIQSNKNTLVVGKNLDLFSQTLSARSAHWLTEKIPQEGEKYLVRIRYSHAGSEATVKAIDEDSFQLVFSEPQRAIAPGQYAVLYDGDRVIGSGEIVIS